MATTTNYGWTTPDDTDLVKDGAAAIRTLGSSIDTTTKNLNPETTLGDIAYRSATANTNTRLAIGTSNQVLTVSGGVPAWVSPAASTPANAVATGAGNSTTSSSYVNLNSSVAVTLTTGTKALVIVRAQINTLAGGRQGMVSYAVSGATTIAASDDFCYSSGGISSTLNGASGTTARIVSGLTAGSNTFTVKIRSVDTGTIDALNVQLSVIDMGS
jgi:hypothetical protein